MKKIFIHFSVFSSSILYTLLELVQNLYGHFSTAQNAEELDAQQYESDSI